MNLKLAIVGLPNVGKSTLFNALTKSQKAEAANFPFCTIDPNVGLVEVPDQRLQELANIVNPEKIQPSVVEFVDIAGLVKGASEGEGLGNQFLSHIRECQAICHVLRAFESSDIHHVDGRVNPGEDLGVIMMELILADLQSINKQLERITRRTKSGDKEAIVTVGLLTRLKQALENENPARTVETLNEDEEKIRKSLHMLTDKPYLVVANVAEDELANFDTEKFRNLAKIPAHIPIVPVSAAVEAELAELPAEDANEYMESLGINQSGSEKLIKAGFELLGLMNYFTAGVKEVRSWTVKKDCTAPQAAGAIHTDFETGFIRAEVTAYADYIEHNGIAAAKEAGKVRTEGKTYIVQDGDVMLFRFNN